MKRQQKRYRKKWKRTLFFYIVLFLLTAVCTLFCLFRLEAALLPALREISYMQCRAISKNIMDTAITEVMQELEPNSTALIRQTEESYTADTVYINHFCTTLSQKITGGFSTLPKDPIQIPLGAATPFAFLANAGPKIPFSLLPMGAARVEYETDFCAVGINQVNYKIWLNISMELKIVNPLLQESVVSERKIMLADLIFGGKVPTHYFQMNPAKKEIQEAGEYLLTE